MSEVRLHGGQEEAARLALDARLPRGEPTARAPRGIPWRDPYRFRSGRWVTGSRPGVDRLTCPWLTSSWIGPNASLGRLPDPAGVNSAPYGAAGFDRGGARSPHGGSRIGSEGPAAGFGLDENRGSQRTAQAVRLLDTDSTLAFEAARPETVSAGLREVQADDDRLARAAAVVSDALHGTPRASA